MRNTESWEEYYTFIIWAVKKKQKQTYKQTNKHTNGGQHGFRTAVENGPYLGSYDIILNEIKIDK